MMANIPNILTITRILLLPLFAAAIIYQEYRISLVLFIMASLTDLLDGTIARLMNQITYFGKILDPVADKFFLLTSFVLLTINGVIPIWLTLIVLSRDLIVIIGCIILYFVTNHLRVEPSLLGKISNASQFILIGIVLISLNSEGKFPVPFVLMIAVSILAAVSGIHYIYKGLKLANSNI